MLIENVVGVKIGIENEVDMEDGNRGWNLEDIAGDSLTARFLMALPWPWPDDARGVRSCKTGAMDIRSACRDGSCEPGTDLLVGGGSHLDRDYLRYCFTWRPRCTSRPWTRIDSDKWN
jgi:hypothetical protein